MKAGKGEHLHSLRGRVRSYDIGATLMASMLLGIATSQHLDAPPVPLVLLLLLGSAATASISKGLMTGKSASLDAQRGTITVGVTRLRVDQITLIELIDCRERSYQRDWSLVVHFDIHGRRGSRWVGMLDEATARAFLADVAGCRPVDVPAVVRSAGGLGELLWGTVAVAIPFACSASVFGRPGVTALALGVGCGLVMAALRAVFAGRWSTGSYRLGAQGWLAEGEVLRPLSTHELPARYQLWARHLAEAAAHGANSYRD